MSTFSAPTSRDRSIRIGLSVFLAVLLAVLSYQYIRKISSRPHRSAILRWQPQILAFEQGVNIAERHNYPNPPIMAILLLPIVKLPPLAAGLAWFYLKVAMTALALFWIFGLIESKEKPFPFWAKLLVFGLSLRPIMGDLQHGNVNLFILFLVVGCLTLYRLRWDVSSGLVLGLAIACKVTPALFLPYLVWKRAWKTLVGCAVGLMLFLYPGYVPALVMGQKANDEHMASWYSVMVEPFLVKGRVTSERENQSLPGVAHRLLTRSPSDSTYVENIYTPTVYSNVASLSPTMVRWMLRGVMGVFGLLILWSCRPSGEPRSGWRLGAEFGLIALGMLLFSERTWKHHCVTLMIPFAVLCYYLSAVETTPAMRRFVIGVLAVSALLMASTSHGLLPEAQAEEAQVYGAYVWANVVLVVSMLVLLLRRSPVAGEK